MALNARILLLYYVYMSTMAEKGGSSPLYPKSATVL